MRLTTISTAALSVLTVTGLALAQDQQPGPPPDQQQAQQQGQNPPQYPQYPAGQNQPNYPPQGYPQQGYPQQGGGYPPQGYPQQVGYPPQGYPQPGGYPPQGYPQQGNQQPPNYQPPPPVPAHLSLKPGTYITVRVNQWLSSDRNQPGDAFAGTVEQPLVVDGFVVAQRGQTVGGRVTEAQKAGRVAGTSRLGLELIDLTLVDGQTLPVHTSMLSRNGSTSVGRDVAAGAATTGVGAAVGAGVDGGRGAAIGAGAGAVVGLAGVLLTRGNPTVVYPESVMTFRIESPVEIATEHAPQAFRYADEMDYGHPNAGPAQPRVAGYGYPPRPYAATPYPYPAYPYGYPYYGPSVGVYIGPGYYWRGGRYYWRR
jgi:hypothetical protein